MANVLSGNLAYVDVVNILKLLVATEREGRLMLQNDELRRGGEIHLTAGKIVHAICDPYLGEPAFQELIMWRTGKFVFEAENIPTQRSIDKDTGQLLLEVTHYVQSTQKIAKHIPSFRTKFKMTGNAPPASVKLKGKDWEILNLLERGEMSITEMASKLNGKELEIGQTVHTLAEAGLVESTADSKPPVKQAVDEKFFQSLQNELIQLIGPVASIIIDDVVESYGEDRKNFPKDKLPALIESISNEIYDPAKQVNFQQTMLKQIKSL